jgi:uncharacterized protein (DUF952 family)
MEILHLACRDDWDRALAAGEYRTSTLGLSLDEVGFIHASTAAQLPTVASATFAETSQPLIVLVLDDDALRSAGTVVRYEDGGDGELFPHIYGPIRTDLVRATRLAHFDTSGAFVF